MRWLPQGWWAALLFAALGLVLIASSSWNLAPAWDEPEHIMAGYTYVTYGRFFYNPFHPPLIKDLAGLALLAWLGPQPLEAWPLGPKFALVDQVFSLAPAQSVLRVARWPLALLGAGFLGLFYLCLRERGGSRCAFWAAAMMVTTPLYLGHAGLVHSDVASAIFIFLALWLLAGYLNRPSDWPAVLPFALAAATAQVVKFNALLLYPVYLLAITWHPQRARLWRHVPLVMLLWALVVGAVYVVHPAPSDFQREYRADVFARSSPAWRETLDWAGDIPWLRRYAWYATGVTAQGRHVQEGHDYPVYLKGELYPRGTSWYFPTLLLYKIPLGLWCLLALSLVGARAAWDRESALYVLFLGSYLCVALASPLNLGLRHLLPVFPLLMALAGRALAQAWDRSEGWSSLRQRAFRWACRGALLASVITTLSAWPGYLSYFNALAGGRAVAVDSDYDWGTDLLLLAEVSERQGWRPMTVHYFGYLHPRHYLGPGGCRFDPANPPSAGWLAVSATHYHRLEAEARQGGEPSLLWERLQTLEDEGWVGAFRVYRIPPALPPASAPAAELPTAGSSSR